MAFTTLVSLPEAKFRVMLYVSVACGWRAAVFAYGSTGRSATFTAPGAGSVACTLAGELPQEASRAVRDSRVRAGRVRRMATSGGSEWERG